MSSSTKPASSAAKKLKAETLTRTVAGLVFYPRKIDDKTFITLEAWVAAGKPNEAYIFDNADTLKVCGIPICDGAPLHGMYRRMPALKPREVQITLIPHLIKTVRLGVTKTKTDGVEVAEVKDHHRMSY